MTTATSYTLTIVNQSEATGSACVYVSPADLSLSDPTPLAWFAAPATSTPLPFSWTADYSFVAGLAAPPVFVPLATAPTDLLTNNAIPLAYADGLPVFGTGAPGTKNTMSVTVGALPPLVYAVGVGIGETGTPAAIAPAAPASTITFTPELITYWITFGSYVPGQVLNLLTISRSGAAEIVFPAGVTSLTATYTPELLWEITPDDLPGEVVSEVNVVSRKPAARPARKK